MSDLLSLAATGVRAYQVALGIVGDNVANADTPGYVRRSVQLQAGPSGSQPLSRQVSPGNGVVVAGIVRNVDALKVQAARDATGDVARLTVRADWLRQLQATLGSGDSSLGARIGSFFDATSDLAVDPTSAAARAIVLDRADQLAGQFRASAAGIDALQSDLAHALADAVTEVNQLTAGLAAVNDQLHRSQAGGNAASGLLDTRDALLGKLGGLLRIAVTPSASGAVEVRLGDAGNGALLIGTGGARRIAASDSPSGPVLTLDPTHNPVSLRLPASGTLSGLIEAQRRSVDTRTALDTLATDLASALNATNSDGVDAQGQDGGALFALRTLSVSPGRANGGNAVLGVDLADGQPVDASGYTMTFLGGTWTLARGDATLSIAGAGPLTLDGVTVSPSGSPQEGDSYALAARDGAAGLRLRPLTGAALAVSDRWLIDSAASNGGTAQPVLRLAPASVGLPLLPTYRVTITGPGLADINDDASGGLLASVTVPGWVAGAGFDLDLTGVPAIGDSFRIRRAPAGSADNGNLRSMQALRDQPGRDGTFEDALAAHAATLASALAETNRLGDAAKAVASDAARAADSVSGVDLDQQAAELTRLQAAYKASSQLLATARDLFDTLLQAAR